MGEQNEPLYAPPSLEEAPFTVSFPATLSSFFWPLTYLTFFFERRGKVTDPLASWFEEHFRIIYGLKREGELGGLEASVAAPLGQEALAAAPLGPLPFSDRPEAGVLPPGYSYDPITRSILGPLVNKV